MGHRFLEDQVNSLEDKIKNIKPQQLQTSSTGSSVALKNSKANPLKHCVVDISVFLNHLNSVKKWIAEEKCIVIVPLDGKRKFFFFLISSFSVLSIFFFFRIVKKFYFTFLHFIH